MSISLKYTELGLTKKGKKLILQENQYNYQADTWTMIKQFMIVPTTAPSYNNYQLKKALKTAGIDEENMCLICFEQVSLHAEAIRCKTCKKIMCFECCCNYSLANIFECESDETGYGVDEKIPCPVCKTINIFYN